MRCSKAGFGLSLTVLSTLCASSFQQAGPRVDLGYEIHEGVYNASTNLYKFSNIRYAKPPIGELRFAAPESPDGESSDVELGNFTAVCPQGYPAWYFFIALVYSNWWAAGNESLFDYTGAQAQLDAFLATNPPPDIPLGTTEDCLFLDVVVPRAVFDNVKSRYNRRQSWNDYSRGAPVVIWIYGGGYATGNKNLYDPSGLIKASQASGDPGIIYVALNYRTGVFGFSSGPTWEAAGGLPNIGFYDQRLAIEWVAKNIHLFGGDPNQITIMGESAGGGSVQHQITAFGGKEDISFQRAVAQSPGFYSAPTPEQQEDVLQTFLAFANVSTVDEARALDSDTLILANARQILNAEYGSFVYNPVVDGTFVPDVPSRLLADGRFPEGVEILTGHQQNEGVTFTPPDMITNEKLRDFVANVHPDASDAVLDYIINDLYPDVYDGSLPYHDPLQRSMLLVSEFIFTCNTNYLNRAFDNAGHAYEFQVPPATHGQDVLYTFYNGQGDIDAAIAAVHQGYITNFIATGDPNGPGLPTFPIQDGNASMNAWGASGVKTEKDPTANERCAWWQEVHYL